MLHYNDDDDAFLNKKLYINHKTRRKSWPGFKASRSCKSQIGRFAILKQKLQLDFARESLRRRHKILKLFHFRFSSNTTTSSQLSQHPLRREKPQAPQHPFPEQRLSLRNHETLCHSNLNALPPTGNININNINNISNIFSSCSISCSDTESFSITQNATSATANDLKQRLALRKRYLRRKRKRKFHLDRKRTHVSRRIILDSRCIRRAAIASSAFISYSRHLQAPNFSSHVNSHPYQSLNRIKYLSHSQRLLRRKRIMNTNISPHCCNISPTRTYHYLSQNTEICNDAASNIDSNSNKGRGLDMLPRAGNISDKTINSIAFKGKTADNNDWNNNNTCCLQLSNNSNSDSSIGESFSNSVSNKSGNIKCHALTDISSSNNGNISSNIISSTSVRKKSSNIKRHTLTGISRISHRNIYSHIISSTSFCNNFSNLDPHVMMRIMILSLVRLSLTTISTTIATLHANAVTTLSQTAQHLVRAVIGATTLPIQKIKQHLRKHHQQQQIQPQAYRTKQQPQLELQQQQSHSQQQEQHLPHMQQQEQNHCLQPHSNSESESECQSLVQMQATLEEQQQILQPCQPCLHHRRRRRRRHELPLITKGLNKYSWIFLLIYLNFSAKVCLAGYNEKRLLHDLLDTYNTLERPVLNESDPLQLSFGLTLMQIIDVDEKNQLLVTNVWLKLEWNDMNLRWNTSDYGGIKDLRIPPHRIWKPDVLMYNSADEGFDGTYQTNVVVRNNGSCLYVPPGIFKSTCKIDITWFPFDDQRCEMKFGSWTYDGFQLDLQLQDETGGDISSYVLNGEWELLGVPGKRNEIYYNCCPEPYIDITFAIIIRRRTLYYFFNLIIPCVLIASMALLGFTLPPDSGEKLSLGVTILLSLTVFLNMVAETMPATSDAVPLLGTYFNCIMFMVASSVVSTILILNYHHRNADTHEMSEWIRVVFLCWLPWILRMHRPGRPIIMDFTTSPCSETSSERKHQIMSEVELKERSSKSLLANVLDIDDDFRNVRPMTPGGTLPHNPAFYRTVYGYLHNLQGDDGSIGPIGSTRMPDAVTHHTCIKTQTEYELSLILKEIRFITDQLRKEDEDNDIANDWKFAAMVVDRLCLIIFTMFTILATIAVLLSAPHIIVS